MIVLLQVDFPYPGPWGNEMSESLKGLAESIALESGLIWKIWTENPSLEEAGGVYLFSDRSSAEAYLSMHTARLQSFGISGIRSQISGINTPLSLIDRAPI